MTFIERCRSAWLLLILVLPLTAPVLGQDLSRIRIAAGASTGGDFRTFWGGHGLVEFSARPGSRLDLRGSGSFAVGDFGAVGNAVFGLDVLGAVRLGSGRGPYLGVGLGYSHTDFSESLPLSHDLGWSLAAGFEWQSWYVESRLRVFGNVFYEPASPKEFFLFSIGRSLGGG